MDLVRRVLLPEAGEGIYLKFSGKDFVRLQNELGTEYTAKVPQALLGIEVALMDRCLGMAAKNADGTPARVTVESLEDAMSLSDIGVRILDAFCVSAYGRTYLDQIKFIADEVEKVRNGEKKDPDPTMSPAASSAG